MLEYDDDDPNLGGFVHLSNYSVAMETQSVRSNEEMLERPVEVRGACESCEV